MIPRPAGPADFAFVRALAGAPSSAPFVTDEDEAALAGYLADPSARLQIWEADGQPAGFALWCGLGQNSGVIELRRLALAVPGSGKGAAFVAALTDHGFETLGAQKIWLDASGENPRACHIYDRLGYVLEGRQRAHWWRPALGRTVDLMLYGMLRSEWLARPAA